MEPCEATWISHPLSSFPSLPAAQEEGGAQRGDREVQREGKEEGRRNKTRSKAERKKTEEQKYERIKKAVPICLTSTGRPFTLRLQG